MCKNIRETEEMLYGSTIKPHPLEESLKKSRYRKIVAGVNINKGDEINLSNVNFMRIDDDLDSIDAYEWNLFSGKKSKKNIQKYSPITLKCIL